MVEKPVPPSKKSVSKDLTPQNLVELETSSGETAAKAIAAYQEATCAIQKYNSDVVKVIESAEATASGVVWQR